jgi:hypothetical protein
MSVRETRASRGSFVVSVGAESLAVFGSEADGWAIAIEEQPADRSRRREGVRPYRYEGLDELLFALINLSVTPVGEA